MSCLEALKLKQYLTGGHWDYQLHEHEPLDKKTHWSSGWKELVCLVEHAFLPLSAMFHSNVERRAEKKLAPRHLSMSSHVFEFRGLEMDHLTAARGSFLHSEEDGRPCSSPGLMSC